MDNDWYYVSRSFENAIKRELVCDIAKWIMKGVEQKNPRVTLDLADSVPLVYSNLDRRLLNMTRLN